ncbi:MAG: acyltransferase family protein [Marinifilaceae bacterium]
MKDYNISIIRLIATCMIVACHFLQYYGNFLAWWLNVGVQVFLVISGFLYGQQERTVDPLPFYKKAFSKILIEYWVYLILIIPIYLLINPTLISFNNVYNAFICKSTLKGLEHLWFIPNILFAYLLTPLLQSICIKFRYHSPILYLKDILLFIVGFQIINNVFLYEFKTGMLTAYVLGFIIGHSVRIFGDRILSLIQYPIIILGIVSNMVRILNSRDIIKVGIDYQYLMTMINAYAHVLLGLSIFIILYLYFNANMLYKMIPESKLNRILNLSDQYSYSIYLVHQFFIFGPFAFLLISRYRILNIGIIILAILFSAIVLKYITTLIRNKIGIRWKIRYL